MMSRNRAVFLAVFFLSLSMAVQCTTQDSWCASKPEDDEVGSLYAQSAVLMDADSGRVLYEKNGYEVRPMASTTKVMTCMVTLENADPEELVTVSATAASQPDVQLNLAAGEHYRLRDLLYSLMLQSHNDSAVAIAEHVGGSVQGFADLMNRKANAFGCRNTYFITPNGLDAQDEVGVHSTTAADLATILSHAIQNQDFLDIAQTKTYSFSEEEGKRNFTVHNTNALFQMFEGAVAGKTGFTGNAGYCYTGAVKSEGRTFVAALLACGWPNHKSYKWSDMRKLIHYGEARYHLQSFAETYKTSLKPKDLQPVSIPEGVGDGLQDKAQVKLVIGEKETKSIAPITGVLIRDDEAMQMTVQKKDQIQAPVKKGDILGSICYTINGEVWRTEKLLAENSVQRRDFPWCMRELCRRFCLAISVISINQLIES